MESNNKPCYRFGIDLGGTKIEIIVLNAQGKTIVRKRVDTPQGNYTGILDVIDALVMDAEKEAGVCTCLGIGTPGAISPATGLMKNSNTTCLNGKPFLQDLERRLARKVKIENDANCFALSEAVDGAAKGAEIVFGVIVGTGTGAGVVINQKVIRGANAISGEWGHNPLPWPSNDELPGLDCYCGKQGCIETWLSGSGFKRQFLKKYGKRDGHILQPEEIVALAEAGDEQCNQALRDYEEQMARGLAHVINILDPQIIVLGGGMSNINQLYRIVPEKWGRYVFSDHVTTRLVPPMYGDSSGVRGAAWLC